ncbi:D-3-phosphoglycerate dehydrogenase [Thermococcus kodakarensis KOD1]|uniref:D-3-phosphoglycerate dehydrogenase n=1 Tax=Thermococcus kodakarensis (strain ATCC BAA-918 / JCM 12380 / KOD1) TaxID=69014 RepID=Q5JGC4_THEKO|nr:hydroxyacid dehydrogenase [Thermococcus kodakarensis]WCN27849.1 hydroxyacid dehydrogenase [Thermococcus kodakarensis]WCN30147.1 hydroxyacid dehydrogenase [Thermococcus kodakarensis]BAD86155.1 D-3-phosphoglycerate dehydrogenase [Thermococcus kodakarensis KOD1]
MKVLVAAPLHEKAIEVLKNAGFEVVYEEYPDEDRLVELVKDVDAIIVRSKPKVTRKVIEAAPKLKVIGRAGVGLDNIDLKAAEERGIKVVNSPGASSRSVAELAIGLIFAVARKIAFADRKMREGVWAKKQCMGIELEGKTIGVVGFGRIGYQVAKIANALGMKVLFYDPYPNEERAKEVGGKFADLETLLKESDVVTLHVPLVDATYHLINEERLKLMKPTAILINAARGAVVDTDALVKALQEGWIAGAGLDVFEEEPLPADHPLTKLDNVVLTPHIGASTVEAQMRAGVEVAEKIVEALKG